MWAYGAPSPCSGVLLLLYHRNQTKRVKTKDDSSCPRSPKPCFLTHRRRGSLPSLGKKFGPARPPCYTGLQGISGSRYLTHSSGQIQHLSAQSLTCRPCSPGSSRRRQPIAQRLWPDRTAAKEHTCMTTAGPYPFKGLLPLGP